MTPQQQIRNYRDKFDIVYAGGETDHRYVELLFHYGVRRLSRAVFDDSPMEKLIANANCRWLIMMLMDMRGLEVKSRFVASTDFFGHLIELNKMFKDPYKPFMPTVEEELNIMLNTLGNYSSEVLKKSFDAVYEANMAHSHSDVYGAVNTQQATKEPTFIECVSHDYNTRRIMATTDDLVHVKKEFKYFVVKERNSHVAHAKIVKPLSWKFPYHLLKEIAESL